MVTAEGLIQEGICWDSGSPAERETEAFGIGKENINKNLSILPFYFCKKPMAWCVLMLISLFSMRIGIMQGSSLYVLLAYEILFKKMMQSKLLIHNLMLYIAGFLEVLRGEMPPYVRFLETVTRIN